MVVSPELPSGVRSCGSLSQSGVKIADVRVRYRRHQPLVTEPTGACFRLGLQDSSDALAQPR
jgi:hypothetical protein